MKKIYYYAFAVLFGAGVMMACSNQNKEAAEENAEEAAVEEQVTEDLQDGTPVEVDVEGAQVDTLANGVQEVQTEVTMAPEN